MARAIEITILRTGYNAVLVSHLTDIYLSALRPYYSALLSQHGCQIINGIIVAQISSQIVAKHPERRPQAVGGVRETDSCFHAAVAHCNLILRIQSSRRTRTVATLFVQGGVIIILTLRVENKAGLTADRVFLYRYVLRCIVLQLGVPASTGIVVNVPILGIKFRSIKIVLPHQLPVLLLLAG